MKPPSELDTLLRQARRAAEPGPQTRARVQAALLARIAAGDPGPPDEGDPAGSPPGPAAPPGAAPPAAPRDNGAGGDAAPGPGPSAAPGLATATRGLLLSRAGVAVCAGVLGLISAALWVQRQAPPEPRPAVASASAGSAPPLPPTAQGSAAPAEGSAPAEASSPAAPGSTDPPGTAGKPGGAPRGADPADLLREETAQLRQAQQALRSGQAQRALTMLGEQDRAFARGVLGQERRVTRILALCALGNRGEAQRLGAALERSSPRSPHLATLRGSCARPDP